MDETREEREELAVIDREAEDEAREQDEAKRNWGVVTFEATGWLEP